MPSENVDFVCLREERGSARRSLFLSTQACRHSMYSDFEAFRCKAELRSVRSVDNCELRPVLDLDSGTPLFSTFAMEVTIE